VYPMSVHTGLHTYILATLPVPVRNARFMCIYGASDSEDRRDTVQDMQLAAAEWLVGDHSFLQY
jgi:hypothetical protein